MIEELAPPPREAILALLAKADWRRILESMMCVAMKRFRGNAARAEDACMHAYKAVREGAETDAGHRERRWNPNKAGTYDAVEFRRRHHMSTAEEKACRERGATM